MSRDWAKWYGSSANPPATSSLRMDDCTPILIIGECSSNLCDILLCNALKPVNLPRRCGLQGPVLSDS